MKRTSFGLAALCLFLAGGAAQAEDVFPPDWRGNFGTMTVGWDYWGPEGSGPRILLKTEGELIQANPGGFDDTWPAWAYFDSQGYVHDNLQGRQSVLEINEFGTLAFRLSNYDQDLPEKRLLFQITFLQGFGAPLDFWVGSWPDDPGDPPWEFRDPVPAIVQDSYDHGDGWQTNSYALLFEPNPRYEGFSIDFTEYPAFIDQVVIDTWCIPEPATLALLSLGGLLVARRRR